MLQTALTALLDIETPVIGAPMAMVSGGALAAAVTKAGGLGLIGGGYCDPHWIDEQWELAGSASVGLGLITWRLEHRPDVLTAAIKRKPAAIFLSFGDIAPYVAQIKRADIPLICQVQTLEQALDAARHGADLIVAQGTEAGGHGGVRATFPLVPEIVDALGDIPVVAGGGIADGRGLVAALMLGAAGVVVGTAFVAANEALVKPGARERLQNATGDQTIKASVVDIARGYDWPEPYRIRTLRNSYIETWADQEQAMRQDQVTQQQTFSTAVEEENFDIAATIVGEGVGLIKRQQSAADILTSMVDGACDHLRQGIGMIRS